MKTIRRRRSKRSESHNGLSAHFWKQNLSRHPPGRMERPPRSYLGNRMPNDFKQPLCFVLVLHEVRPGSPDIFSFLFYQQQATHGSKLFKAVTWRSAGKSLHHDGAESASLQMPQQCSCREWMQSSTLFALLKCLYLLQPELLRWGWWRGPPGVFPEPLKEQLLPDGIGCWHNVGLRSADVCNRRKMKDFAIKGGKQCSNLCANSNCLHKI